MDKLAPIRQFFELFVTKFKSHYSVEELVITDEQLEKFRGNCPIQNADLLAFRTVALFKL
jgi:hypothetical protein